MPIITTANMVYLGNFVDFDPNERNFGAENIQNFTGTVVNNDTLEIVTITESDASNDGVINDNEWDRGDNISYTLDDGTATNNILIDTTFTANVRFTLSDDSTRDVQAVLIQTTNGDIFLGDLLNNGSADNLDFQRIEILNITGGGGSTPFSGLFVRSSVENSQVVCFTQGTEILTPDGPVRIENLRSGDLVLTGERGPQPIRWIGRRTIDRRQLAHNPKLCPVRISAGALGTGLPRRDLVVSRQHRMLVSSKISERMFGTKDVLVAAIKLVALPGIDVDDTVESVEYFHILLDRHEVVFANGAPSETLLTGPEALKSMPPKMRDEIFTIFPEVASFRHAANPARMIPGDKRQKKLIARHAHNAKPLLATV